MAGKVHVWWKKADVGKFRLIVSNYFDPFVLQLYSFFKIEIINSFFHNFNIFLIANWPKNAQKIRNCEQKQQNQSIVRKILTLNKSVKNRKKNSVIILFSTLDGYRNPERWIYRSTKTDCIRKPVWVYTSSPAKVRRNN